MQPVSAIELVELPVYELSATLSGGLGQDTAEDSMPWLVACLI